MSNPDVPEPVPSDLPEAGPKRQISRPRAGIGGTFSHSSTCRCNPCKARRRQAETLPIPTGVGGMHLAPESAPLKEIGPPTRRKVAPKSLRDRVAQFLHYSMLYPTESKSQIADRMGLKPNGLYQVIKNGQEAGILTFEDPLDRIDYEIIPKVVDNLNYFLDAKDKTVTIEAAKGTIFKAYADSKGISEGANTILALKIEPADGQSVKIVTGHIVGKPKGLVDDTLRDEDEA